MIRKIIGFLCSAIFCTTIAVGMPQMAEAAEEITINEANFPDGIFREYVTSEFDKDKNNKLSEEEIAEATYIYVDEKGIGNLKGVEYFTDLISLSCYNNQLKNLDVSKNIALTYLMCGNNQLTGLNVSNNIALTELNCNNSWDWDNNKKLTALDISNNTALTRLNCYNNQLKNLDVSKNTALTYLDCGNNQLTVLNVGNNTYLTDLNCGENQLTSLNVSNNTALISLNCYSNPLRDLDVSKNTTLANLNCYNNQLKDLDVSKNTVLTDLYCSSNQLTNLNVGNNTSLTFLYCGSNELMDLDVSKNAALIYLDCSYSQLTDLNINNNIALTRLNCNCNQLTNLNVSNNTALTELDCNSNQLTNLDVSHNVALTFLHCSYNQLSELKLNSQTYDKLPLYKRYLHDNVNLSDLQNITETETNDSETVSKLKVTDITKPATYKVDGKDFTIIYADTVIMPSTAPSATPSTVPSASPSVAPSASPSTAPSPSISPAISTNNHIFSDYNYNIPVSGSAIIYGNGISKTIDGTKVNNKALTVYTDITASYKYTVNSKGIIKPSVGKVIVGVTKSNVKPEVSSKNKITDTSAANIAKARIKNGQITVTSVGKEGGIVYLWVIDTGNKGVSACCPIDVKLAPKKLEVQDTAGSKLQNTKLANGNTLEVCVAGFVGSTKTDDCTYTVAVDQKYSSYITATPVQGSKNKFTIKATGLKNDKDTKASITFVCDQNGKKAKFSLTITK